jgi:RNA-binding protein YhbY
VKLLESAPTDARGAADEIARGSEGVHPVQTIGRTAVLYRRHQDDPVIRLPSAGAG